MPDEANDTNRMPKLGDRVQIVYYPGMRGRIIELRQGLGRGGRDLYRVKLFNQPRPAYIEIGADQIIFLDEERA